MLYQKSFYLLLLVSFSYAETIIENLNNAKVGECYKKITIPAKYSTKNELIEVEKPSKKVILKNPIFKEIEKNITVIPRYIDIKDSIAKFKKTKITIPINKKKTYFTIGKKYNVPLKKEFISYLEKQGLKLKDLKENECYIEYAKIPPKKIVKKEYVKKQAYEIIDVQPAKFKIIKKKIQIKPAYTKIIKTPAIYETKVEKVLVSPAQKIFKKLKNDLVCIKEKKAVYKRIVKKVLISPPKTKLIKFPPTFKEIEIKVLETPPKVSRRVIPPKKDFYDFFEDDKPIKYFWLKAGDKTNATPTGLKICKKTTKVKYIEKEVEKVLQPASTKEINVPAKIEKIKIQKLLSDANITTIDLPAQYEEIKSKVKLSPAKIVWKKVKCKQEN